MIVACFERQRTIQRRVNGVKCQAKYLLCFIVWLLRTIRRFRDSVSLTFERTISYVGNGSGFIAPLFRSFILKQSFLF